MDPIHPSDHSCTRLVPSLAVPSQTVVVQPLYPNTRPLSERDLFVLQRTVMPVGQSWLYQLQGPDQPSSLVQVQMWITPTIVPYEVVSGPHIDVPPLMRTNLLDLGIADNAERDAAAQEGNGSDMTGAIYGDR